MRVTGHRCRSARPTGSRSRLLSPVHFWPGDPISRRKWGWKGGGFFIRIGARGTPTDPAAAYLPAESPGISTSQRVRIDHHHRPKSPPPSARVAVVPAVVSSRGDAAALMPPGEDTRLYNYGVPVIGRSKLRFPAPREQGVRGPTGGIATNMRIRPGRAVSCSITFLSIDCGSASRRANRSRNRRK